MNAIAIDTITQAVINHGDGGKTHPRLYKIYTSLVKHLHAFVREVNLTEPELQRGRDFINRVSRHTQLIPDGEIQLLTDLLGISVLVELLQDPNGGATEANLQGPTYVPNAPQRSLGDRIGVDLGGCYKCSNAPKYRSMRDSYCCPQLDRETDKCCRRGFAVLLEWVRVPASIQNSILQSNLRDARQDTPLPIHLCCHLKFLLRFCAYLISNNVVSHVLPQ